MKILIILGILLTCSGCAVGDFIIKTRQSFDCVMERYPTYCEKAKTDAEKSMCMNELQDRCVHYAVTGEWGEQ